MTVDLSKTVRSVGSAAFATIFLASCSQDWSATGAQGKDGKASRTPYETGRVQMSAGHYGLALQSFRKALSNEPQSVKVLNALAATYDLLGRFDLAERYYRRALVAEPRSIQTLNNFGYSYFLSGRHGEAKKLFDRAARLDAKNPVVAANQKALSADLARLAEAKRANPETAEGQPKQVATAWVERTGAHVQALITKPDPAFVKKAHENGIAPRLVHVPRPLIEIVTTPAGSREVGKAPDPRRQAKVRIEKVPPVRRDSAALVHAPKPIIEISTVAPEPEKAKAVASSASVKPTIAEGRVESKPGSSTAAAKPVKLKPVKTEPVKTEPGTEKTAVGAVKAVPENPAIGGGFSFAPKWGVVATDLDLGAAPLVAQPRDGLHRAAADDVLSDLPKLRGDIARDVARAVAEAGDKGAAAQDLPQTVKVANLGNQDFVVSSPKSLASESSPADDGYVLAGPAAVQGKQRTASKGSPETVDVAAVDATTATGVGKPKFTFSWNSAVRLEIANGTGRLAMAKRMGRHLKGLGIAPARLTNADHYSNMVSVLQFRPGATSEATLLSKTLPFSPQLTRSSEIDGDLRLVLGADLLGFDGGLIDRFKKPAAGK